MLVIKITYYAPTAPVKLCHSETMEMMLNRWGKLVKVSSGTPIHVHVQCSFTYNVRTYTYNTSSLYFFYSRKGYANFVISKIIHTMYNVH